MTTLLDIIERDRLYRLRERIEKNDELRCGEHVSLVREQLCEGLSQEKKELVDHFEVAVENKLDFIYFSLEEELLNLAFRLGMEMQRAFDEEEFDMKR